MADKVTVTVEDRRVLQRIARELLRFDHEMKEVRQRVGEDAELIFAAAAPKGETGRLSRGIRAIDHGDEVEITAEAVDPETGFDYVRVTRFGHRVARIFAGRIARSVFSQARFTKSGGLRKQAESGSYALRTPFGPRASVRGYKPLRDWAEPAYEKVEKVAERELAVLGRGMTRRLGSVR